jgi:hypothetical protein
LQNNDGISVKGNITWDDGNNQAGLRPETITIQLSQNNTVYKSTETKDKNISSYSFTGLPKYTYDSDGNVNGTYTYSIKEIFTPVPQVINEDTGKTVDVYTITYSPTSASVDSKDGNGTINIKNTLTPPNAPYILPVKDVINSITVVTNINTYTEVVFKKLEQTLSGDGSVTYGTDYSDIHYNVDVNNIAKTIHDMDAGKYEIEVLNPLYILDNIKLSDSQDVELVKEGDTYYLIIKETDHDTYGTVTINLSKKDHIGYQSGPDTVPDPENPKTEKKTGYTYSNMFKH